MSKSRRLVHIVDDVPEIDGGDGVDPVDNLTMVLALDGFLDAGNAAALAVAHLLEVADDEHRVVATFEVDEFHDYRARRPAVSFVADHYESYDAPRLVVRLLHDTGGTPYLLLQGPEPDNRWEAFARAVREVVERFDVTRVVAIGSVPMAVPHTRPISVTPHATRPELVLGKSPWRGELRVPSSAQSLLEIRLGEWGHDALGFVAHIPHYLAQLDYPRASVALLEQVELGGKLTVDLTDLREAATSREDEIRRYLDDNEEVNQVVVALERQYDTFERAEESGQSLLADDTELPTGDQLGAEFEQFLAGLESGDPDGRPEGSPDRD